MPMAHELTQEDRRLFGLSPTWIPVVCGAVIGVLALQMPVEKLRWIVAAFLVPIVGAVAFLIRHHYRLQLGLLVFSLQLYVWITFLYQGSNFYGAVGPSGLEIYLPSLMAAAALAARWAHLRSEGATLRWGREMMVPTIAMAVPMAWSMLGTGERLICLFAWINVAQLFLIYFAALNLIRSESDLLMVTKSLMFVAITQSGVYALQYVTGVTVTLTGEVIEQVGEIARHGGTVGTHPATYAEFMNPLFGVSLALFMMPGGTDLRRWTRIAAPISALGILLSFTRAAWIAGALGALVLFVGGIRRRWIGPRRVAAFAGIALVVLLVFLPQILLVFAKNHHEDMGERLYLQEIAMNVIEAHPIIGIGLGTYAYGFRAYVSAEFEDKWLFVVHNVYLLRAAETGVLGMLTFIVWLLAGWRLAIRCMSSPTPLHARLGLGCLAGFIAMSFQFYLDTGSGFSQHALYWFLLGTLMATRSLDQEALATPAELPVPRVAAVG